MRPISNCRKSRAPGCALRRVWVVLGHPETAFTTPWALILSCGRVSGQTLARWMAGERGGRRSARADRRGGRRWAVSPSAQYRGCVAALQQRGEASRSGERRRGTSRSSPPPPAALRCGQDVLPDLHGADPEGVNVNGITLAIVWGVDGVGFTCVVRHASPTFTPRAWLAFLLASLRTAQAQPRNEGGP